MISLIRKRKDHKFIGEFKILYAPTSVVRSHGDRRVPVASRAALHPPVLLLLPSVAGEASRLPRPELRRGGEYRLTASDRPPRRKPKAVRVAHLGGQRTEGASRHRLVSSKCNLCVFSCFVQFVIWNGIEMDLILFFSRFIANKLTAITDADHYGRLGIPRDTPYDQVRARFPSFFRFVIINLIPLIRMLWPWFHCCTRSLRWTKYFWIQLSSFSF